MKSTSSYAEILESLRHPVTGVGFLTTHPSLPSFTFVSADAVHWLINNLEGINSMDQAVGLMSSMLKDRLICHASGDFSKPFVFGFYLYHIVNYDKGKKRTNLYLKTDMNQHKFVRLLYKICSGRWSVAL